MTLSVPNNATSIEHCDGHHCVHLDYGTELRARAVLVATGARYRWLEVPRLERFEATSVYYAATVHEANACGVETRLPSSGLATRQGRQLSFSLSEKARFW